MRHPLLGKLLIAAFVPALAWAQTAPSPGQAAGDTKADTRPAGTTAGGTTAAPRLRDARASKLIGMDVRDAKGESLGNIRDLIVDVNTGRVRYAVLSFGGFLGLGDKLFAYPVQAFKASADRDELVLNVERDRLKEAPGFERNRWPGLRQYAGQVDQFFARMGIGEGDRIMRNDGDRIGRNDGDPRPDVIGRNDSATGKGERSPQPAVRGDLQRNPNLRRASELIGRDIRDQGKRNAGEIEDLVVSMGDGRVRYVVIDFDKAWSPDDKLLALPLSSLRFADRGNDVTLNVARERLDMSRGFDESQWPDLNDARYRGDMDRFLAGVAADGGNRQGSAAVTGRPPTSAAGPGDTARERQRESGAASR